MSRRLKRMISWIVVIAIVGGSWYYYKHKQQPKTTYQTATASKGTLTVSVSGTGNVEVAQSAKVNPTISGTVTNLSVNLGDQVKKGQKLFYITNNQLDSNVAKAYASYLSAKQNVENDKAQLLDAQNNQTTIDNKSTSTDQDKAIADQKVTAAQAALDAANSNVTAVWSDYQQQLQTAAQRNVTAPIDGTISALNIGNGDQIGSGSNSQVTSASSSAAASSSSTASTSATTPIVIEDLSTLKASVQISEVDASNVKAGQKVSMTFDAVDGLTLTGKVEKIDSIGTVNSGVVSYGALINFDSVDNRVKPGMSVTATITTDVKQNILIVPNSAVKAQTDGTHYVSILQNGSPVEQTVQIGSTNDASTEITSGLNEGDNVVTQTITSASSSSSTATTRSGGLGIPGLGGGIRGSTGGGGGRSGN